MFCGVVALLVAATRDVLHRVIPDLCVLVIAIAGLAMRLDDGFGVLAASLGIAVLLFAAMVSLFHLGALGGGDVKLLAAASLLSPPAAVPGQLMLIAFAGGILAVGWIVRRKLQSSTSATADADLAPAQSEDSGLPYGVAICAGTLIHLALLP